jgi:Ca-activated chloride channel family protein
MLGDGTAIGTAIAVATNRLLRSDAESKVIILLTDGVNNMGEIDPITAANAAKAVGVKIYTIGQGKEGQSFIKLDDVPGGRYVTIESQVDEESLREIADITDGKYFRAIDPLTLGGVFEEIGELERTEIESKEYMRYSEMFEYFLTPGLAFVILGVVLGSTVFRRIP